MSAMVAYPSGGGLPSANTAMYGVDTASLNGGQSSSTSGCQSSQGGDDAVERSRSSSPISLGAFSNYIPKNGGQLIRNRIFVCGFGNNTAEEELRAFFEQYGNVKDVKVIADKTGSSKGYGFITFESEEEAKRIIKEEQHNNKLNFKDRTLNIGPAIKREIARSNAHLAAQLNHVLTAASVPELTAGPALYYQSPATLAQVLLPATTCTYPNLGATASLSQLGIESPASAYQYATYANQTPVQYAVLGNQFVNYSTTPFYATTTQAIGANAPPYIDQKYVQSAINGTLNTAECFSNSATQTPTPTMQYSQLGQSNSSTTAAQSTYNGGYAAYPQASLSSIYAASGAIPQSSELMYYGRTGFAYQQPSLANSVSSLSSSVDSTFPNAADPNCQQQVDCNPLAALSNQLGGSYCNIPGKLSGAGDAGDIDIGQTFSTMNLGTANHDLHVQNETNCVDMSSFYQQPYAPQMYNSIELVQAAAAAAAWTYQQNLQNYAKSIANSSATSNFPKASPQQPQQQSHNHQQHQNHHHAALQHTSYACKTTGSPMTAPIRQPAYK